LTKAVSVWVQLERRKMPESASCAHLLRSLKHLYYTLVSFAAAAGKGEKRREDTVHQSCAPAQPKGREHITELHAPFSAAAAL